MRYIPILYNILYILNVDILSHFEVFLSLRLAEDFAEGLEAHVARVFGVDVHKGLIDVPNELLKLGLRAPTKAPRG